MIRKYCHDECYQNCQFEEKCELIDDRPIRHRNFDDCVSACRATASEKSQKALVDYGQTR